MEKKLYERCTDDAVTDMMLEEASKFFSENYGVWSKCAAQQMGKVPKAGRSAYA